MGWGEEARCRHAGQNKTWDNNLFFDPGSIYLAESREPSLVLQWVNECMLSGNKEKEREVGTGTENTPKD